MKIVISHVFGAWNKGDWVLLQEIIQLLRDAFPDAHISGITRNAKLQKRIFPQVDWFQRLDTSFKSQSILRKLQIVFGLANTIILSSFPVLVKIFPDNLFPWINVIKSIIDADLVIMCPGGYWDATKPSFISNLVNLRALTVHKKGTKIIWAPQSI